jgi:carboxyl-terminal processing protease
VSSGVEGLPELHPYLRQAIDIVQEHALMAGALDWDELRREARAHSSRAMSPADCYPAIEWALGQLGDHHSFFEPPERGSGAIRDGTYRAELSLPSLERDDAGTATLVVPAFRGSPTAARTYADTLRGLVHQASADGVTSWVVDVAHNGGGNMLPMIAGLAPLLGAGTVGGFLSADDAVTPWTLDPAGAVFIGDEATVPGWQRAFDPALAEAPVGVVTGPVTASSGEAVVLSLRGRPRTRSFGAATRGLATCNDAFDLPDGASLMVTTAWMVDRQGAKYPGPVVPDVVVRRGEDPPRAQAARWAAGTSRT